MVFHYRREERPHDKGQPISGFSYNMFFASTSTMPLNPSLLQHHPLQKGDSNILVLLLVGRWTWEDRPEKFNPVLPRTWGATPEAAQLSGALNGGGKGGNSKSTAPIPACSKILTVTKLLASSFSWHGSKCRLPLEKRVYKKSRN